MQTLQNKIREEKGREENHVIFLSYLEGSIKNKTP